MVEKMSREVVAGIIGNPADADRELREYAGSARVLSSNHPRLIDEYPEQWVGVHGGKVELVGPSLDAIKKQAHEKGIPLEQTIIRFIEKEEKTLIT
ncbi:MAG TPA: hypothetical protein VHZ29_13135 [Rhizomicrobium sp.]|jgi:hypothetical protein|nr:hypothetical protein [Rhizomicrobium sp.]